MPWQCGFECKLCTLISGLYYNLILQYRTTKAGCISGHRYQFFQRRARKTRSNPTQAAAAAHCPAHLVLCRLRRCTSGNVLERRSLNTRREPGPSPARCCGATHSGRILERGRHGVRRPRLAIRWVGPEIRPQASAPFARTHDPSPPPRRPSQPRPGRRESPQPCPAFPGTRRPGPFRRNAHARTRREAPESARPATIAGLNSTRPAPRPHSA